MEWAYIAQYLTEDYLKDKEKASAVQTDLQKRYPDTVFVNPRILIVGADFEDVTESQVTAFCLAVMGNCNLLILTSDFTSHLLECHTAKEMEIPIFFYMGENEPLGRFFDEY